MLTLCERLDELTGCVIEARKQSSVSIFFCNATAQFVPI